MKNKYIVYIKEKDELYKIIKEISPEYQILIKKEGEYLIIELVSMFDTSLAGNSGEYLS